MFSMDPCRGVRAGTVRRRDGVWNTSREELGRVLEMAAEGEGEDIERRESDCEKRPPM
jgi:hypothetical protein